MNNIFVLNKNYKKIGTLSNQGVKPQAPYYNDLYTQELDTGADTYQFSTISNAYTQDCIEIGNHIMFAYKNRNELFTITSIEYSHSEGYKTIGVYAEGIGFELLEVYMERPKVSNSGGSGGTDNDNDGDDNYDDEYADVDDIYIDANGNIIYDKDGSGLGDVTIDGNGNIIYKRSKNNKNNDSLEFKNISYPTFLNILLKNTGWSFVCQPGLESIKHDITVKYDTNIYAILQDSMQSYRGVELEFVFEYNNGNIKKTLKAYKDGGRGSFIGKRFEYGTNIKGITKTQKVANSKDDTVLYVDDVGIEVFYDVDFALKSAEVPEIEIGDTHYVIDTDFHPPMNIKARIGKIEVSFTDPTKNKIYLANNKKISGAVEEINEDSIKDLIDDSDNVPDHDHCDLINSIHPEERVGFYGGCFTTWSDKYDLGHMYYPWNEFYVKHIIGMGTESSGKYAGFMNIHDIRCDDLHLENAIHFPDGTKMTTAGGSIGGGETTVDFLRVHDSIFLASEYYDGNAPAGTYATLTISPDRIHFGAPGMTDSGMIESHYMACEYFKCGPGLDLINPEVEIKDGVLHADEVVMYDKVVFPDGTIVDSSGWSNGAPPSDGSTPSNPGTGGGTITDGFDIVSGNELFVNKIDAIAIEVAQVEVTNSLHAKAIITPRIDADIVDTTAIKAYSITFSDGSVLTTANGTGGGPSFGGNDSIQTTGIIQAAEVIGNDAMYTTKLAVFPWDGGEPEILVTRGNGYNVNAEGTRITPDGIEFPDGSTLTTANGSGGGDSIFQKVSDRFYYTDNDIQIERDLYVNGTLHINSGDGMGMGIVDCDILKVVEIQFANGTKLPVNNIATVSELSEYATVEALQEEVRIKDEKIASLEARLATIEAMLGINNDN